MAICNLGTVFLLRALVAYNKIALNAKLFLCILRKMERILFLSKKLVK